MKNFRQVIVALCVLFPTIGWTQALPFEIAIEPMSVDGLGGIQSYAFGQADGKWLIVGGRLDGLHRRQPWATFDIDGHNNQLIVVDPEARKQWSADLAPLPQSIREQLSSTNMEFYQEGDFLYCFGGYGYSETREGHTTYPYITAIDVPAVIDAVVEGEEYAPYFRQVVDTQFQVTGGRVGKIDGTYYLLGGQKFIGRYNPMGPDHGPGFFQEYTNAIRIFSLTDDGENIEIEHLNSYTDTVNLHRRDYNAAPQIMPDGEEGITMFSGVFRYDADLPFWNCVNVDGNGYAVNDSFKQYFNHYHCAFLPMYSEAMNEMHTVFFGGIAQYYEEEGVLYRDNDVPFVKTIARVTRDANGIMTEHKLPVEMPALLGAGAEFIPDPDMPRFGNDVLKLDDLESDTTHVGYIYGGIESSAPEIFWVNDGTQSIASGQIYRVLVVKGSTVSTTDVEGQRKGTLDMSVYPNPSSGMLNINYHLVRPSDVRVTVRDANGALVDSDVFIGQSAGENSIRKDMASLGKGKIYFITIETSYETFTQKLMLEE